MELSNKKAFDEVTTQLGKLGYRNELLEKWYKFPDYFANKTERVIPAVAFGQTPTSYETACIAVLNPNGAKGRALVNQCRALCSPVALEVDKDVIREWAVSKNEDEHQLVETVSVDQIEQLFVDRAQQWMPEPLLRAKNIGSFHSTRQLSLFAGLVPELEARIQSSLEPLLEAAMSATVSVYDRKPNPAQLFKLIFRILTAKVFHDRRVNGFRSLSADDPDEILSHVARKYKEPVERLLNRQAREIAVSYIWDKLDFRNLSVEVLAQMWSTMLIDDETKRKLGIHRTPRTIVRYIVEKIPFEHSGDDNRIIFEPCTGSSAFLIGAMNYLRPKLWGMPPAERHQYFKKRFVGVEKDPFGVEISKLALTLADFPNIGGWKIHHDDVFRPGTISSFLRRSGAVLCNPPFEKFDEEDKANYETRSPYNPVELLHRVLDDLHPHGVIGFVLPLNITNGKSYKEIRTRLAARFGSIELTALPDRAFPDVDTESGLLVATEPIPHNTSRVVFSKVNDNEVAWKDFELSHRLSSQHTVELLPSEAAEGLSVPDLPELWAYLSTYGDLKSVATLHRGIEWSLPLTKDRVETGNRSFLVKQEPEEGYMRGVAPQTKFNVFQEPGMAYLNRQEKYQRGRSFQFDWHLPKAIVNQAARSRGAWRLAAFADSEGVIAYQSFIGVWSKSSDYDEHILAAILNSPVANAFVAGREGKKNITLETLEEIPVPKFTSAQITRLLDLVKSYQQTLKSPVFWVDTDETMERSLMEIDAVVLDAYRLPPRLEHELLVYFRGYNDKRPTAHAFRDYLTSDSDSYFSLSTHLSPKFQRATAGAMREHFGIS
jgi:hypothetical protein